MKTIKEVIVVEGKSDVAVLKNFINAEFIITNGSQLDDATLQLIEKASAKCGVILFLDPDAPGEKIRKAISDKVKNVKHAFVSAKHAKKGKKLGVAETKKIHILEALENVVTFCDQCSHLLSLNDLYTLGLTGQKESLNKRFYIEEYFHIGHGSAKTMLKRLNMLRIDFNMVKQAMEEHENG